MDVVSHITHYKRPLVSIKTNIIHLITIKSFRSFCDVLLCFQQGIDMIVWSSEASNTGHVNSKTVYFAQFNLVIQFILLFHSLSHVPQLQHFLPSTGKRIYLTFGSFS